MKLDYTITSPVERREYVNKMIQEIGEENLNDRTLEAMANYLVFCMETLEKKEKKILTDNRMTTVNKREASMEGLTEKLENGEDGLYNMITNDKNVIFAPSISITKEDLAEIAPLRQLREAINEMEFKSRTAVGKDAFKIKQAIIQMRRDQYTIKAAYRRPIYFLRAGKGSQKIDWEENVNAQNNGDLSVSSRCSILNPKHVSALLCNYNTLKQNAYEDLGSDIRWLMADLEDTIEEALSPMYRDILILKLDAVSNLEIQAMLQKKYNIAHSLEYISSLYRNKIPKLIAEKAQDNWLQWNYTNNEKGVWKTCTKCGESKLAHNRYYSKNKTAASGWYSICKECRNSKTRRGINYGDADSTM